MISIVDFERANTSLDNMEVKSGPGNKLDKKYDTVEKI